MLERERRKLYVAWAALVLAALPAHAQVRETFTIEHYDVAVGDSLLQSLNAASPVRENGQVFHGLTRWNVSWNFRWWEEADGRCRVTQTTVDLTVKMTLPRLVSASPQQRRSFETYLAALRRHEDGHHNLGKLAAQHILDRINWLPQMARCSELEAAANEAGRRVLQDFMQRERRYDAATGYGETQGAKLVE